LATVVIELKWSNNEKVLSALAEQLGKKYLLAEGRHWGIFLVGWLGKAGESDGKTPRRKITKEALESMLVVKAKEWHESHPDDLIAPVVWDLPWPSSGKNETSK